MSSLSTQKADLVLRNILGIGLVAVCLSACQKEELAPVEAQRFALEDVRPVSERPLASPNTDNAVWTVSKDGKTIRFGHPAEPPFLSLVCQNVGSQPQIEIVRHVRAKAGQQALFPVIGNGMISRFKVDAALLDEEWRWQGSLPANDAQLDVFTGKGKVEATLPGGGTLAINGSRIPGEFISWCRAASAVQRAVAAEATQAQAEATQAEATQAEAPR